MREIEYRALNEYGKWVYGTPILYKNGDITIIDKDYYSECGCHILNNGKCHSLC